MHAGLLLVGFCLILVKNIIRRSGIDRRKQFPLSSFCVFCPVAFNGAGQFVKTHMGETKRRHGSVPGSLLLSFRYKLIYQNSSHETTRELPAFLSVVADHFDFPVLLCTGFGVVSNTMAGAGWRYPTVPGLASERSGKGSAALIVFKKEKEIG